ncbi:hypothetical protein CKO15_04735 [Halorhodospira abdelmalekii]|uniref:hypothetical protein n=1 Tax=Halorhodospira abdelmalekii TaxID=421629 RepID=UPI0019053C24|nr:hypothetical protein [Halorhodospira abdelmalekii]MBK1734601.1 hypothetical protein [Halorhodospira abdelmalekii]
MFTALVSPEYAERYGQNTAVAGGFIAHGLVPSHRSNEPYTGWFYALLPGSPEEADTAHVRPFPANRMEAILRAERDRYLAMAHADDDSVWADAAASIDDMIACLQAAHAAADSSVDSDAAFSH